MNPKTIRILAGVIVACAATSYVAQELRIKELQKRLKKTATVGLLNAQLLEHAVKDMTEEQARQWLENWMTEVTFAHIVAHN